MAYEVPMPRYGATMEEGTLGEWMVSEGDTVEAGDILFTVEIEKLTNEVESPQAGIIRNISVEEGDTVLCGDTVCVIAAEGEDLEDGTPGTVPEAAAPAAAEKETAPAVVEKKMKSVHVAVGKRNITPKAQQLAEELNISCDGISGTGRYGMVTREDVRNALKSGTVQHAAPAQRKSSSAPAALSGIRKVIAQRMMESKEETAPAAIWMDADVTDIFNAYKSRKRSMEKGKLSFTSYILKAVAAALRNHPVCRTQVTPDGQMKVVDDYTIAIAVDAPQGLMVPTISGIDHKEVSVISEELSSIADKARVGALGADDMKPHMTTVSNLGMFGVRYSFPILNRPESVIIGAGKIEKRPVYIGDGLFPRYMLPLSMTFDHRIVDGAPASAFLQEVCSRLSESDING